MERRSTRTTMGLLNGNRIVEYFQRGLYNHGPETYVISVDGELIRYKGMVSSNLTRHDAEEAIAQTSYGYLVHTVMWIERYMGRSAQEVIVYMDGARVANKTVKGRPDSNVDNGLIRTTFARLCAEHGYSVHALGHGESELQMYLQRNRDVGLNILLTRDSDMLSICYGHVPRYYCTTTGTEIASFEEVERRGLVSFRPNAVDRHRADDASDHDDEDDTSFGIRRRPVYSTSIVDSTLLDLNDNYGPGVRVLDSCAWFACGSSSCPMQVIGFDACAYRIGYNDRVFRTFASMCGTDFTVSMLPPSMFTGFFSAASEEEKRLMNSLTEPVKIIASVVYLGLKGGGMLKRDRGGGSADSGGSSTAALVAMVSMYYEYISTGVMADKRIPTVDPVATVNRLISKMRSDANTSPVKKQSVKRCLADWVNSVSLERCLHNMDSKPRARADVNDGNGRPTEKRKTANKRKRDATPPDQPFVHFMADPISVLRWTANAEELISSPPGDPTTVRPDAACEPRRPNVQHRYDATGDGSSERTSPAKTEFRRVLTFSDSGSSSSGDEYDRLNVTRPLQQHRDRSTGSWSHPLRTPTPGLNSIPAAKDIGLVP